MTVNGDPSATLVLRVWTEGGTEGFRSRLTTVDTSVDGAGGELTVAVTASPADTVEAVRAWLDDFLRRAADPTGDGG